MSLFKKNAGFTLVELIVVIAILGILAGVAIPTYNGYIEKAKIAGDQQELHNLNLAFATACADAGESNFGRTGVAVSTSGSAGSLKVDAVVDSNAKVEEAFEIFYPDADAGVFEYYTALFYDKNAGGFLANAGGLMNETGYRKGYADAAKDFSESNNSYKSETGEKEAALVNTVGNFATALSNFLDASSGAKEQLLSDPKFAAFLKANNIPEDDTEMVGKAMVLYAAQELSDVNPSAIHAGLLNGYDAKNNNFNLEKMSQIMHGENASAAESALDGAALAAVIAGYANSDYATEDAKNFFNSEEKQGEVQNVGTLLNYLNGVINAGEAAEGKGFAAYLNSTQSSTDVEAFVGGLGAVHHGSKDVMGAFANGDDMNTVVMDLLYGKWSGAEG